FDLKETDLYFCSADIGWITGHSYVVYGLLANGATVFMYEGAPNEPGPDRFWRMIDRHGITIFYTAPTAIRAFMRWGDNYVLSHNLRSLRLLGSVGEPINPEAWMWYHRMIGKKRCPIVDTWWQTETGSIMITPLPGITGCKPGSATHPFFGVVPKVVDENGVEVPKGSGGKLIIEKPWPSMLRTLWGDDERFQKTYFSDYPGIYFTGDGARQDKDGYFWIVGRIDDVLNISGHRLGTAEVESALVSHPSVAEAAAVGRPDDLKGQSLVCFVTLKAGIEPTDELKQVLRAHVAKEIGALARPDVVRFAAGLPKTRSGKIMRRILKQIAAGTVVVGDTTTLEDFSVVATLQAED
ncbi:MAG: AMP-binding protein, partial [Cephaloticoccus sp.]|nr:AMP-binding protein [Cephaloticoccus sp.]